MNTDSLEHRVADQEFDDVWLRAPRGLPVHNGVVRDATFMKFSNGQFRTDGTSSASGELVGYVSSDLALANMLTELEFALNDFRLLFVCDWIDGVRNASRLALERWYLGVQS